MTTGQRSATVHAPHPATNGIGHADDASRRLRRSHLEWVPLGAIVPAPHAQREFSPAWANELAATFNLEGMGFPVLSKRNGTYFCIDGQHRLAALRILGFAESDQIQCEVYEGLSEKDDSELFIERNDRKAVVAFDRFRQGVAAGRRIETEIDTVVRHQGLCIARRKAGGISAVGALLKVHAAVGPVGLGKSLRIIRDAYGTAGFDSIVIEAVGLCVQRYEEGLEEETAIRALNTAAGGLHGLLNSAEKLHLQTGQPRAGCLASTIVSFYNRQAKKKLAAWWKE